MDSKRASTSQFRCALGILSLFVASLAASGTIVGNSFDNNGVSHGFVRHPGGSIVPFDAPGAAPAGGGTLVFVISDSGALAGAWGDANGNAHGFVME